ncbi:MAG: hypothetical protein FWC41_02620, partial [Firmicutes bacterium]|nr:hypothetical protein [Bacillota bacterium]
MLVNVTNIQLTVNEIPVDTVSNMMFFKLRVDYVGGPDGIHNGDTISIKIDNIANDILKITGFGNTTSNIYGDEPIGKVGTRTYRNDQDGNYYLDIVFDDGYMNVLGPIAGITGWYEASAYIEYKREVLEPGDQTEIEIFANAIRIPISVNVKPGGGVGPIPIDTPGSIVGKSGRYGDHSGNVYDIPEVENNNYAEFDPMRWNIYIGYQNLTWRDLRGSGGTSYFTTANSLNFSNNNPIDNRYQSVNEPYLVPYKPAPWFEIDAPFHYKNVEIDDYLVIGSHNGAFASGQNFVRESLRIIKVLGREENNTWWGKDAFRVLADSNFLIESENEPIDRFLTDLFFKGYRGLKIDEFLSKLQSEGQFLGKTVDDILKFDYVKNSEAPFVVDYKDYQIGHFNLKLGDFYFSSTINEILNLVGTSNEILFKNIPAKNLPYAYWIYFDTNAIEAVLDNGAFFYENVASLKYSEGQHNTESNPLWIKVEDASGGGGKPTELRIKKVDENDNQLQ